MPLSFSVPAHCVDPDLRQAVPAAREMGFAGVQINVGAMAIDLTTLPGSGRRELRHLFSSHHAMLTSLRADTGPAGLGPGADVDRVLDRADKLLNLAAGLGCGMLCLDLGRLPPAQRAARRRPKVTPEMAGLLILPEPAAADPEPEPVPTKIDPTLLNHWRQALGHLCEIADRYGTMIAFGSTLSSFDALVALVRGNDCPWFGIDLDTTATLHDNATPDVLLDASADLLRHVRLRDAVRGDAGRSRPATIGRGDVPWRAMLEALLAAGFQGPLTIDPAELTDARASALTGLKQLQALLAA